MDMVNDVPHEAEELTAEDQTFETLRSLDVMAASIERYGVHPDQIIEWFGPDDGKLVCFIHGGFFHEDGTLAYLRPAAFALGEAGFRVALPEYRRLKKNVEATFEDLRTLALLPQLQGAIWIGHSLGGALAADVLFDDELPVTHAVLLAPILDLARDVNERGIREHSSTAKFMGGLPEDIPDVYERFEPLKAYERIEPAGFASRGLRLDIIHGANDETVPVQRSRDLAQEPFNIAVVPGANHSDLIRPGHDAWLLLLGALN
ncbi:MAG: alpha/beta fold hydrolase [Arcanobacterium sp.]|nr:alpha/beta fold hydrolase [Arcanobacterium sp.]